MSLVLPVPKHDPYHVEELPNEASDRTNAASSKTEGNSDHWFNTLAIQNSVLDSDGFLKTQFCEGRGSF